MKSIGRWRYWDVSALAAGVLAATATLVAMKFDLWGEALPLQALASIVFFVAAFLAWRSGERFLVFSGLICIALSWVPLGLIVYSCAILKNCP